MTPDAETSRCLACGAPGELAEWLRMPMDSKKFTRNDFSRILRCERCDFGAVLPRPPAEALPGFYDLADYYTHGRSHLADAGDVTLLDRVRVHLAWRLDFGLPQGAEDVGRLAGQPAGAICDVRCGDGRFAAQLAAAGHRVVAIDPDPRVAAALPGRAFDLFEGSAECLPEPVRGHEFDVVVLKHVLEHCPDPAAALRNVVGLLKPDGRLLCEVPNNQSAGFRRAGVAWEMFDVPRHLNFFNVENLAALCRRHGLEFESVYFYGYCRQFSNEWIRTERRICDELRRSGLEATPRPARNSRLRAWWLLLQSGFAPKRRKYDSFGVVARRIGG